MGTVVYRGELEIEIEHEPHGFCGRGAITIKWPPGIKYRMTLEDAESVGDMLIEIVRRRRAQDASAIQVRHALNERGLGETT